MQTELPPGLGTATLAHLPSSTINLVDDAGMCLRAEGGHRQALQVKDLQLPLEVACCQVALAEAGGSKCAALQGVGVLPLSRQLELVSLKLPHLQQHKYALSNRDGDADSGVPPERLHYPAAMHLQQTGLLLWLS